MKAERKEIILLKLIKLLSIHQTMKGRHCDSKTNALTDERWEEIDKNIDRVTWLYEGRKITDNTDKELVSECCKLFSANEYAFRSRSRKRELIFARAFYVKILTLNGGTPDDIAAKINRDRTNYYNVIKSANNLIETDKLLRAKFEGLLEKFKVKEY